MAAAAASMASQVPSRVLDRELYGSPVVELARRLLGTLIISEDADGRCAGRIVETEAYGGPEDRASHARAGRTRRTAPMFGPPGHAYVYLVYGMHECLNVVAESDGHAGAVLLRAIEPTEGIELMRRRRDRPLDPIHRLASGPARLAQALGVSRALDGHDLTLGQRLWLELASEDSAGPLKIAAGPRIGVAYAGAGWAERPWRFWLADSPAISR